jgi:hypothetical protein
VIDGPLQFEKTDVDTFVPTIITKYGKEFSIVEVPYCLKLLMHELTTMNVQMRLITADTIDSLTTAGKRSMGEFKTWAKKEPPLVLEKQKVEKLLNQTLSDEEFKAIVDPELEPMGELEEYEPTLEVNTGNGLNGNANNGTANANNGNANNGNVGNANANNGNVGNGNANNGNVGNGNANANNGNGNNANANNGNVGNSNANNGNVGNGNVGNGNANANNGNGNNGTANNGNNGNNGTANNGNSNANANNGNNGTANGSNANSVNVNQPTEPENIVLNQNESNEPTQNESNQSEPKNTKKISFKKSA